MTSHRIRLRGFWTSTALPDGRQSWSRKFGKPRTLEPHETAWLTADILPSEAELYLNDEYLGQAGPAGCTWNVTHRLRPRNEVRIFLHGEIHELFLDIHALES